jgi:hypothetical protein
MPSGPTIPNEQNAEECSRPARPQGSVRALPGLHLLLGQIDAENRSNNTECRECISNIGIAWREPFSSWSAYVPLEQRFKVRAGYAGRHDRA